METLGFNHYFNYVDHKKMETMLAGEKGNELLSLAKNISACLHEDWKGNLVREKGTDYQHFRPVKDAAFAEQVLNNREEYLSKKSSDGKPLFRILESEKDGEKVFDVQFDLIRVPFAELTEKWQDANLDAAKFALCLVKTAIDQGDMQCEGEELFKNFEKMSHDVHLEWMFREGGWAEPNLLLPYEYLTVDTNGYNQKDKDRAHVKAITNELTFQPNILARNRAIALRAISELFESNAIDGKLKAEIANNLKGIQELIDKQNELDYDSYIKVKKIVKQKAETILKEKQELVFDDLERIAATYFEAWKESVRHLGKLPKSVDVPYKSLNIDDVRVNYKNISRSEVKKILQEMIKEKLLNEGFETSVNDITNSASPIGKKITNQNEQDYANFVAMQEASQPS